MVASLSYGERAHHRRVWRNRVSRPPRTGKRMRDRSFVVNIRFDRLKLRIIKSKQLVTPIRVP
jgi:hypothetical protein